MPDRSPNGKNAYLFASVSNTRVSALSVDPAGGNLPAAHGPWRPVNGGAPFWVGGPVDEIGRAIFSMGIYLVIGEESRER